MINIIRDKFTNMIAIHAADNLTSQALALTPSEAAQLRDQLNALDLDVSEASEGEARRLKHLTLYNGHALPEIDRAKFESENVISPKFTLDAVQTVGDSSRVVKAL